MLGLVNFELLCRVCLIVENDVPIRLDIVAYYQGSVKKTSRDYQYALTVIGNGDDRLVLEILTHTREA